MADYLTLNPETNKINESYRTVEDFRSGRVCEIKEKQFTSGNEEQYEYHLVCTKPIDSGYNMFGEKETPGPKPIPVVNINENNANTLGSTSSITPKVAGVVTTKSDSNTSSTSIEGAPKSPVAIDANTKNATVITAANPNGNPLTSIEGNDKAPVVVEGEKTKVVVVKATGDISVERDNTNTAYPFKEPGRQTKKISRTATNNISSSIVDKRVSLTCCPKTYSYNNGIFAKKILYVLGKKKQSVGWLSDGETNYADFYGLLYNSLSSSAGLIFPYTPKIGFHHSVSYDTTEITHSNLSFNSYKNTPPPTIDLIGKFTADTRENALHMLSAIWFCIACTKCEFGLQSAYNGRAGLPPPILYLSGYDNLIDNIPVVISSVNYDYPDDLHYVNLVLDMSMDNTKSDENVCSVYDSYVKLETESKDGKPVNSNPGTAIVEQNLEVVRLSFWLPTELTLTLQLKIQPNLLKTKKQWDLDDYKTGLILTNKYKTTKWGTNTVGYEFETEDEEGKYTYVNTQSSVMIEHTDKDGNRTQVKKEGKPIYTRENFNSIPSGWTW